MRPVVVYSYFLTQILLNLVEGSKYVQQFLPDVESSISLSDRQTGAGFIPRDEIYSQEISFPIDSGALLHSVLPKRGQGHDDLVDRKYFGVSASNSQEIQVSLEQVKCLLIVVRVLFGGDKHRWARGLGVSLQGVSDPDPCCGTEFYCYNFSFPLDEFCKPGLA